MGRFKVFVCFPHLLPVGILCRILSNDFSLFYSCSVINFFYLIRAFLLKEFSLLHFEANISRNKRTTFDAHQCLVKNRRDFMENKLKQYFPIIQQIYFYGSIKGVYTIVLFEKSPVQFHKYPDVDTHYMCLYHLTFFRRLCTITV